ncbi:MAG: hypothetical protein IM584_03065 [Chitinophagaceae bacterium]|nr:hypothetical protein [Chitinophagaceae bacterium]
MRLSVANHIKPVHYLLAAMLLLAIALLLLPPDKSVPSENSYTNAGKEGTVSYYAPLLCI